MDNKLTRDFAVKFNELNSDNQRYIIAIQQALAYAQSSALEAKKAEEERLAAEAKARLEAQRKAEQEALEARRAEEARKAAEAKAALEAAGLNASDYE